MLSLISVVMGVVTSFLLEIVPGLKDWWSKSQYRPAILAGLGVLIALIVWALTCFGGLNLYEPYNCGWMGAGEALIYGIMFFMGSQTAWGTVTHKLPNAQMRARKQ